MNALVLTETEMIFQIYFSFESWKFYGEVAG